MAKREERICFHFLYMTNQSPPFVKSTLLTKKYTVNVTTLKVKFTEFWVILKQKVVPIDYRNLLSQTTFTTTYNAENLPIKGEPLRPQWMWHRPVVPGQTGRVWMERHFGWRRRRRHCRTPPVHIVTWSGSGVNIYRRPLMMAGSSNIRHGELEFLPELSVPPLDYRVCFEVEPQIWI